MELNSLAAFVAVAEARGFSRAAARLVSTQPTLSRQVKALEQELGRPLFDRLGRRVELTAFGRESLDRARSILSQAQAMQISGRASPGQVSGLLRLGVADSVALKHFPPILLHFQRRHPGVRVHVRTAGSPDILNWVRDGECDAGLCMLPRIHPELKLIELWKDRFVCLVPPDHALADKTVKLSNFATERQIAIQAGTLSHQVLTAAFLAEGLPYVPDMTFDNFHLIVDLVTTGVGVGIVSWDVAEEALRRKHVVRVQIDRIDRLRRSIGLVRHAERAVDGALAAFCEEVDRATAG
jgi:DNA-binding transcriptional LysR family regulator